MATVIPVDEFITDEWYPGFKPGYTHAPWYIDPVQTFRKEDEETFWFLDFHWPRGLTPMGLVWNEDGYNWSSFQTSPIGVRPRGQWKSRNQKVSSSSFRNV